MMHRRLSFAVAVLAVLGLFIAIQALKQDEGQALASSSAALGVDALDEDARYSSTKKRMLRRALMADDAELLTLNGRDVREILRVPELVRRDLPTVVWQYRNEGCVLDLYFTTSDPQALKAPVVHYEVRARQTSGAALSQAACLQSLVRARAGQNFVRLDALYKAD